MISVIVPVFNGEKHIGTCVKACLEQLEEEDELIIINDGSTDKTEQIILPMLKNKHIIYYSQENSGVSVARNKGLLLSKGEYIVFVDVDDKIYPNYIDRLKKEIKRSVCDLYIFSRIAVQDDAIVYPYDRNLAIMSLLGVDVIKEHNDYLWWAVWSKAYRRDFLFDNNIKFLEDCNIGEDLLFVFACLIKYQTIAYIHKGYYEYIQDPHSVIHKVGKQENKISYLLFYQEMKKIGLMTDASIRPLISYVLIQHGLIMASRLCNAMNICNKGFFYQLNNLKDIRKCIKEEYREWRVLKDSKVNYKKFGFSFLCLNHFPAIYILLKKLKGKV